MKTWMKDIALLAMAIAACMPKPQTQPAVAQEDSSAQEAKVERAAPAMPGENVPSIKVDTVGFPSGWQKVAIFNFQPTEAKLVAESGAIVQRFEEADVREFGLDPASQDRVWSLDFSAFADTGRYHLEADGARSDVFTIEPTPYRTALIAAQKAFYFQRTRTKLEAPYAVWEGDAFTREGVSHAHEDVGWLLEHYPERRAKWPVEAGWHDAGNFDMYVPSTAPSAHGLLRAYAQYPELFADGDLNIPESGNGIPDILDEARWGLRWVLSMQEPGGGFRLREATSVLGETGVIPADRDRTLRWIDAVGSASTAKGCAVAASAARIYAEFDPEFAARAEAAAQRAWAWLLEHPERVMVEPRDPAAMNNLWQLWDDGPKVASDVGARFVAAAEMFQSFREPSAETMLRALMAAPEARPDTFEYGGWGNLTRWGMMTLADDLEAPDDLRKEARQRLVTAAGSLRERIEQDGYLCATKPSDYYWGSNSTLLEKAELLLAAARLDPGAVKDAQWAARQQWHWILGRNPNGFSMVTRIGKAPQALYHLEWGPRSPKLPPGYLVGGPNHHNLPFLAPQAPAKALLWQTPTSLESGTPIDALWHWQQSDLWEAGFLPRDDYREGWWAVTEPDIYYNANLVLIAAAMQKP